MEKKAKKQKNTTYWSKLNKNPQKEQESLAMKIFIHVTVKCQSTDLNPGSHTYVGVLITKQTDYYDKS